MKIEAVWDKDQIASDDSIGQHTMALIRLRALFSFYRNCLVCNDNFPFSGFRICSEISIVFVNHKNQKVALIGLCWSITISPLRSWYLVSSKNSNGLDAVSSIIALMQLLDVHHWLEHNKAMSWKYACAIFILVGLLLHMSAILHF